MSETPPTGDLPQEGASAASAEPPAASETPVDSAAAESPIADAPAGISMEAPIGDAGLSDMLDQAAIEELLKQAAFEDPGGASPGEFAAPGQPLQLPNLQQAMSDAQVSSIDLLRDVELNVKIELGRSRMLVEDVLKLGEGSVVELDKLAGDPVDVFVNERLVARGEVLVLNENFCVRVNEIVASLKDEGQ